MRREANTHEFLSSYMTQAPLLTVVLYIREFIALLMILLLNYKYGVNVL